MSSKGKLYARSYLASIYDNNFLFDLPDHYTFCNTFCIQSEGCIEFVRVDTFCSLVSITVMHCNHVGQAKRNLGTPKLCLEKVVE